MGEKDILVELDKVRNLVKNKIEREGGFLSFVISYSLTNKNRIAHLDKWSDEEGKEYILTQMIDWLKEQSPYAFIFTSFTLKRKFANKEDYEKDINYIEIPTVLITGRTPDKNYNISLEYKNENGKPIITKETLVDVTNNGNQSFLDEVFKGLN